MKPNDLAYLLNSSNLSPVTSKSAGNSVTSSASTRKRKAISIDFLLDTPRKLPKVVNNVIESPPLLSQPSSPLASQYDQQQCQQQYQQQYTIQPIPLPSPKLQASDRFDESDFSKLDALNSHNNHCGFLQFWSHPSPHSPVLVSPPPVSGPPSPVVPASMTNQGVSPVTPAVQPPSPKATPSLSALKIASALRTRLTYAKIKLQNGWESKSLSRIERMNDSSNKISERANICDRILINSDRVSFPEPYQVLPDSSHFHHAHKSSLSIPETPTLTHAQPRPRINSEPDITRFS